MNSLTHSETHFESNALSVLVTRPKQQGEPLVKMLKEKGVDAVSFPTLDITPKPLTPMEQNSVEGLDSFSHVICVSANAARLGLALLSDYWPQWPVEQRWIAVGPATHTAMQGWGLGDVGFPQGASHSEGVLALESLQELHDQKVLILRGVSGRELLAETLRQRGAEVEYLELYERVKPIAPPTILAEWLCSEPKKAIVVTSGDGLKNLLALAQESQNAIGETELERTLYQTQLVVVSPRLADFAKGKGFAKVAVAEGASDHAIVTCTLSCTV